MKKIYLSLLCITLLMTGMVYAQTNQFNYQAAVRDAGGAVLINQSVALAFDIRVGSPNGASVYSEIHNTTTNDQGLVNVGIGGGSTTGGNFSAIDWSAASFFLNVTLNGTDLGTSPIRSVPVANYALNGSPWIKFGNDLLYNEGTVFVDSFSIVRNGRNTSHSFGEFNPSSDSTVLMTVFQGRNGYSPQARFAGGNDSPVFYDMGQNGDGDFIIERFDGSSSFVIEEQNGNIGLGEDNPEEKLHVNGAVRIDETTSTPSPRTIYGNSGPLAYGEISINNVSAGSYGIASVTNPNTGEFLITLTNSWSGAPAVSLTSYNSSADTELGVYIPVGNNQIRARFVDENNNPINTVFSIIVFGTPQ